jgi:glucokinase
LNKSAAAYIGVEIGASKVQAALGNSEGTLLYAKKHRVKLEEGAKGILNWLLDEIPEFHIFAAKENKKIQAIGVGFGGIIESARGISLASVQVEGWQNFAVKDWFEKQFGLETLVLNDTVAGGCGEYYCCTDRKASVFFYTNIGSGIGGCLICNGGYFDGSGYGGAYFGHTYIPDWSGSPGSFIKVETMCSGFGIERRLNSPGYIPEASLLNTLKDGGKITCSMLGDAARKGDAFAVEEINRIADSYALGLSNVITLFGASRVVIGGGVAKMGDVLLDPVRQCLEKYVFFSAAGRYTVTQSKLMDNAVLAGAIIAAAGCIKTIF